MDQNDLLDRLNAVLPAQFDVLVFRLHVPVEYLSQGAPQATRATEVLRYLKQVGRLGELEACLDGGPAGPHPTAGASPSTQPAPVAAPRPALAAPVTILFLAANPAGTDPRALDQEARSIQKELESSGHRDRFVFETRWAVEPLDLLRELRKLKPTIVHFAGQGHRRGAGVNRQGPSQQTASDDSGGGGSSQLDGGLYFQARDGSAQLVSTAALEQTFGAAGASVKLVVLNACYSEPQADALATHVDCVVGVNGQIAPQAAKTFSIGFYGGLGERATINAAFQQGRAAMHLEGLGSGDQARLKTRNGIDANRIVLADPR